MAELRTFILDPWVRLERMVASDKICYKLRLLVLVTAARQTQCLWPSYGSLHTSMAKEIVFKLSLHICCSTGSRYHEKNSTFGGLLGRSSADGARVNCAAECINYYVIIFGRV